MEKIKTNWNGDFQQFSQSFSKYTNDDLDPLINIEGQSEKRGKFSRVRLKIGFGFTSDWLKKWREFLKPITEPTRISLDSQVKPA